MLHCQCENIAHFGGLSPNGNPGHKYGQTFCERYIVDKKTLYGTFLVCKDCSSDCHQ